jgi:hypothetical protein
MPEFGLPLNTARGFSLAHCAESMLRAMGGGEVMFRVPAAMATAGDTTREELGLEPVATEDIAVSPVLAQRDADGFKLLMSSKSLEEQLQRRGESADTLLQSVISILTGERTLRVQSYSVEVFAGTVYLYRIIATE